jgi:hypothetical protein
MPRTKAPAPFLECPSCGHDLQGTKVRICPECDNDTVLAAQAPATFNWIWLITVFAVASYLYTSFKAWVSIFVDIQLYDSKLQGFVERIGMIWWGTWYVNVLDAWVVLAPVVLLSFLVARRHFLSWPRGVQYGTMILCLVLFFFDHTLTITNVLYWGP